jgi:hypothetical protein
MIMGTDTTAWPALPYPEWAATKKTLHMYTQMLGKVRLALAPPQPEWLNASLRVDARGLTTGAMPWRDGLVDMAIDVHDVALRVRVSDGRERSVPLHDGRCVADVWDDLGQALSDLGIALDIWEKPQESADTTHFSRNRHDCAFDAAQARRFLGVMASVQGVLEEFRAPFFGRSGVQFWWGSFDLTVLLFNGRKVEPPHDRGYIMRYDLDAEHLNAGFWPGDDNAPQPALYGYLVPRPPGCETAPVEPARAGWVEEMGMWLLPYDAVRESPDPRRALLDFLDSVYALALDLGGWDAPTHEYELPAPAPRGDEQVSRRSGGERT